MDFRDRVKELRRVRASDLAPHPDNWRTHPASQREALRGVLSEVGYADAVVARELADGKLQLIDGHLRAQTTPDAVVPVLVVELSDDEARRVLLTHDPLALLAGADAAAFERLREGLAFDHAAVDAMLDALACGTAQRTPAGPPASVEIDPLHQVVVECADEADQRSVYERMRGEGYRCRVLTL